MWRVLLAFKNIIGGDMPNANQEEEETEDTHFSHHWARLRVPELSRHASKLANVMVACTQSFFRLASTVVRLYAS